MSGALSSHINSSLSETHKIIAPGYERTGRGWMRSGKEGEKGEGGDRRRREMRSRSSTNDCIHVCSLSPRRLPPICLHSTLAFVPYLGGSRDVIPSSPIP